MIQPLCAFQLLGWKKKKGTKNPQPTNFFPDMLQYTQLFFLPYDWISPDIVTGSSWVTIDFVFLSSDSSFLGKATTFPTYYDSGFPLVLGQPFLGIMGSFFFVFRLSWALWYWFRLSRLMRLRFSWFLWFSPILPLWLSWVFWFSCVKRFFFFFSVQVSTWILWFWLSDHCHCSFSISGHCDCSFSGHFDAFLGCLFRFNIALTNFSVIWRCLVVTGSSVL